MIRTKGVVHFSIPVTDTVQSSEFYCRHLGMTKLHEDRGMVFLDCGGDAVVLVKVDKPISTAHVRDVHHSFLVAHEEYAAACAELKSNGVKFLYEETRDGGVIDGPRAYFEDPDGNTLEIIDLTFYGGTANR